MNQRMNKSLIPYIVENGYFFVGSTLLENEQREYDPVYILEEKAKMVAVEYLQFDIAAPHKRVLSYPAWDHDKLKIYIEWCYLKC